MNGPTVFTLLIVGFLTAAAPRRAPRGRIAIAALALASPGIASTYATPGSTFFMLGGVYLVLLMLAGLILGVGWTGLRVLYYPRNRKARALEQRRLDQQLLNDEAAARYLTDPAAVFLPGAPTPDYHPHGPRGQYY